MQQSSLKHDSHLNRTWSLCLTSVACNSFKLRLYESGYVSIETVTYCPNLEEFEKDFWPNINVVKIVLTHSNHPRHHDSHFGACTQFILPLGSLRVKPVAQSALLLSA